MNQEAKTLLESRPDRHDPYRVLADQTLMALSHSERIGAIEQALLAFAHEHNDKAALETLEILRKAYEAEEQAAEMNQVGRFTMGAFGRADARCREHLKKLYWKLPDKRQVDTRYDDFAHKHVPVYGKTLVQTKLEMLRISISDWKKEPLGESLPTFLFVCKAYDPTCGPSVDWLPEEERKLVPKRMVFKEEEEGILQLIRQHLEHGFDPDHIAYWLEHSWVPPSIQRVLVIARARKGDVALARREIRYAELLVSLRPDDRSAAALELHKELCQKVAALDSAVKKLLEEMQDWRKPFKPREIGSSEYVLGNIGVNYTSLEVVEIFVDLEADCSEELGRDIFGRARRHIEKWREGHPTIAVALNVAGGKGGLNLNHRWRVTS